MLACVPRYAGLHARVHVEGKHPCGAVQPCMLACTKGSGRHVCNCASEHVGLQPVVVGVFVYACVLG
eukprot:5782830-Alexandrium_andersonii.AAC.1